ncbi:MAG: 16S rRNA (guanine(527)-N(7))-methyltransferase RsmG [Myxococcota bacterium]
MPERSDKAIDPTPIRTRIEAGLQQIFGSNSAEAAHAETLTRLVLLLAQWAPRMNLTGHRDPLEMTSRLLLDAAALVGALPELSGAVDLADLGSGAGFPGLPIAILRPHLQVYLVDARQRRHHFQREARRVLGLGNVEPLLGRSEKIQSRACDVVVAQAMAQPEDAIELMKPWARAGGLLVLPASDRAERPIPRSSGEPLERPPERRCYRVPYAGIERQLWILTTPGQG